ncbi:MAG TPA: glycosyltransferase family 4 protein [Terracidiphilus sp.]|nr:glycosyltransferase family 4 protein [Terracidiphilus sp.]
MRIAIVASPFISIPPVRYGGTELFVATLAEALVAKRIDVAVYANGESTVNAELRWRYPQSDWPLAHESAGMTKELDQVAWAIEDAARDCDIVHVNSAISVTYSRFSEAATVCTLHHPFDPAFADLYARYPNVFYVAISNGQASHYPRLDVETIHHGIDLNQYSFQPHKEDYLCFLGRIAPLKGVHQAIEVAKKAGIPLKIAGEVQPVFRDYFETQIKPHIDNRFIEYIGEADLAMKNELFGRSMGFLFPIEWEEPFGLVMVEAMACGTPVYAFARGAVPEVICEGVSGSMCNSVVQMAEKVRTMKFNPKRVRQWVAEKFSAEVMAGRYLDLYRRILQEEGDEDEAWPEAGEIAV